MRQDFSISKRKIDALSNGILLVGLGVLFFTNTWWPGILIVVWAWLGLRQWLSNRKFDLIVASVILWGLFLMSFLNISLNVLVPVLFVLGGIYIVFREFYFTEDSNGEDVSQELMDDADLDKK